MGLCVCVCVCGCELWGHCSCISLTDKDLMCWSVHLVKVLKLIISHSMWCNFNTHSTHTHTHTLPRWVISLFGITHRDVQIVWETEPQWLLMWKSVSSWLLCSLPAKCRQQTNLLLLLLLSMCFMDYIEKGLCAQQSSATALKTQSRGLKV